MIQARIPVYKHGPIDVRTAMITRRALFLTCATPMAGHGPSRNAIGIPNELIPAM
jgi:hypothetical protein